MACRVRVRLRRGDRAVVTSALLNSGFESDSPDIAIPVNLAKTLGLWPIREATVTVVETGGGEVESLIIESALELELILEDREPRRVIVNALISPHVREVLISDYVASQLGIVLLDFKRGLWRLNDEDKVRTPEEPQLWS